MANETKQLTVADLEAAKKREEHYGDHIAATCIGIVEEMVKFEYSNIKITDKWITVQTSFDDEQFLVNTEDECGVCDYMTDVTASHIVALHNLWLKAVAAFGGEVK